MNILSVIPLGRSMKLGALSYLSTEKCATGSIVSIPLKKQEVLGLVISSQDAGSAKSIIRNSQFSLKKISKIHNKNIFSKSYLEVIKKFQNYSLLALSEIIKHSSPKFLLNNFEEFNLKTQEKLKQKNSIKIFQNKEKENINNIIELAEKHLTDGNSLHIICPTQILVEKLAKNLESKFEQKLLKAHAKISKKKQNQLYIQTQKDKNTVLVSSPLYLDTRLYKKKTLVLFDESNENYLHNFSKEIDLRKIVELYSKETSLNLYIYDSLLRPELVAKNKDQDIQKNQNIIEAKNIEYIQFGRQGARKKTDQERIDELEKKKNDFLIDSKIISEIKKEKNSEKNIFLYVQRKNLATVISCTRCGKLAVSKSKKPYRLALKNNGGDKERFFISSDKQESIPAFDTCQFCASHTLKPLGLGTEKIAEEIRKHFPKAGIHIIDGENLNTDIKIKRAIKGSKKTEDLNFFIGTKKALPYIKELDRSYIISSDSLFSLHILNQEHQFLRLIQKIQDTQEAKLFIQTRLELKKIIPSLKNSLYENYLNQNLTLRKILDLDPFAVNLKLELHVEDKKSALIIKNIQNDFKNFDIRIKKLQSRHKNKIKLCIFIKKENLLWDLEKQDAELKQILMNYLHAYTYTELSINPNEF